MATLIAAGTTQVDSADFTLAADTTTTLMLFPQAGQPLAFNAIAEIQRKAGTEYTTVGRLYGHTSETSALLLTGAGTYRVRKLAGPAFGVDRD